MGLKRREHREVDIYRHRNNARNFDLTKGFNLRAPSCKVENGNLIIDPRGVQSLWRKHFSTLLQGDDDTIIAFRDHVPNAIEDGGVEILPPIQEEVKVTIMRL